jgi:hypothetical protein
MYKNIIGKLSEKKIIKFRLSISQKMQAFLEPDHNGLNYNFFNCLSYNSKDDKSQIIFYTGYF